MKNLKINGKMLVGFGSVILMMLVITLVVLFTNLSAIRNVELIEKQSTLQMKMNHVLEEFNNARRQATIIFNMINQEANVAYEEYAVNADSLFQDVYAYIEANPSLEESLPTLQAAYTSFGEWQEATKNVVDCNTELDNDRQKLLSHERLINELSATLLESANSVITGKGSGLEARVFRGIAGVRLEVRELMYTFNTDNLDKTLEGIDTAIALTTQHKQAITNESQISKTQALLDSLQSYRDIVVRFGQVCDESYVYVDQGVQAGDVASDAVAQAALEIDESVTARITSTQKEARLALAAALIAAGISLALAIFIAGRISNGIRRPILLMQRVMQQAGGEGDLNFDEEIRENLVNESQAKDEMGQSLQEFVVFVDRMRYVGDVMESIARKDLSDSVDILSDRDTMGHALSTMLVNLNEMMVEIQSASVQVSSASGEIALGAQLLAQGTTEQASTIEEISASMGEISNQSRLSSSKAHSAAEYSNVIAASATTGNEKMAQMLTAVTEINGASHAINNVIKIIDDIAFQTNILALNAAVEAARAGEHGKGFSVVASEVRALAQRSASSAKETAQLISINIEKSNMGVEIAQDTAQSLKEIVAGLEGINKSLEEIAQDSAGNEHATEQVNIAVEQVAQVIQQNSATSEESAAASEELNGQAHLLLGLVEEFKLRQQWLAIGQEQMD